MIRIENLRCNAPLAATEHLTAMLFILFCTLLYALLLSLSDQDNKIEEDNHWIVNSTSFAFSHRRNTLWNGRFIVLQRNRYHIASVWLKVTKNFCVNREWAKELEKQKKNFCVTRFRLFHYKLTIDYKRLLSSCFSLFRFAKQFWGLWNWFCVLTLFIPLQFSLNRMYLPKIIR